MWLSNKPDKCFKCDCYPDTNVVKVDSDQFMLPTIPLQNARLRLANRLLWIAFLFVPTLLSARDQSDPRVAKLRDNPRYLSASGTGADLDAARHSAEKALVSQIQVAIGVSSNYTSTAVEHNTDLHLDTEFITRHQSFAGMLLKGLGYIESPEKNGYSVFAYIHRDSLAASYAYQKTRIVGLVSNGLDAVKRGSPGEGLKVFHQAWLLAHFYPDTINFEPLQKNLPQNPLAATESLIRNLRSSLDIKALDCYKDDDLIIAPLRCSIDGKPVKDLSISYYGGKGMEYARIKDGKADVPLEFTPIESRGALAVTIEYIFDAELKADPELAGLYEMFGTGDFQTRELVDLRYPWIMPEPAKPPAFVQIPTISPFGQPVKMVFQTQPTIPYSEPLEILRSQQGTTEFLDMLVQYSKLGNIEYGRKNDFGDGIGCHVAVFDDKQIIVFLRYDGVQYRSFDDKQIYSDLSTEFKGMRQVWIRETGK